MKLRVGKETRDLPIVTVTIVKNKQNPDELNMFYCFNCQARVDQYTGTVHSIDNSDSPKLNSNVLIRLCKNKRDNLRTDTNPEGLCGKLYYFQLA